MKFVGGFLEVGRETTARRVMAGPGTEPHGQPPMPPDGPARAARRLPRGADSAGVTFPSDARVARGRERHGRSAGRSAGRRSVGVVFAICASMFLSQAGPAVGVDLMRMFRARGLSVSAHPARAQRGRALPAAFETS